MNFLIFETISCNNLVVTKQLYLSNNYSNNYLDDVLSNNYLDDVFTLNYLLGWEKAWLKIYFNWKFYLPCFISSSSSWMNTPIGNNNPCNILRVVFTSFYSTILFLKGSKWIGSGTALLCYCCHRSLYRVC